MRTGSRRVAAFLAMILIAAGCGGSPATPGAGGSASSSAGVGVRAIAAGKVDPAAARQLLGPQAVDQQTVNAQVAALANAMRTRISAGTAYGQVAIDLEKLYDQAAHDALQKMQDKLPAQPSASGKGPATQADAGGGFELAAYREPAVSVLPHSDVALMSVNFLYLIVAGGSAIDSYDPRKGDIPPNSFTTSSTISAGGKTLNVNVAVSFSSSGGVVTGSVAVDGTGNGTDANGKTISLSGGSRFVFSINPCPDPGGRVSGTVSFADDETFSSGGGPTIGYKVTGDTDYTTQVDDRANVASTQMKTKVDVSITTTKAATNGSSDTSAVDMAVSASETANADGSIAPGDSYAFDSVSGPVTVDDGKLAGGIVASYAYAVPELLVNFASNIWRNGKCFEIRPDPDGKTVASGSVTSIEVTVYHWVDKAEIQVPLKASLNGTKAIDPSNTPVTSKATFKYTAGKPGSTGEVTYEVASKRGKASRTSTFKVEGSLMLDITGKLLEQVPSVINFDLNIQGSGLLLLQHDDGSVSVNGQVAVTGMISAPMVRCTGTVNEKIPVVGKGTVTGPTDAPVYEILLGPETVHSLGEVFNCPLLTGFSNEGDFFGQWSTTIGKVQIPVEGGTVPVKGNSSVGPMTRSATGTYVGTLPKS